MGEPHFRVALEPEKSQVSFVFAAFFLIPFFELVSSDCFISKYIF